jgi:hypothetical protein
MWFSCYREFQKRVRNQLPPIDLKDVTEQNATKAAIEIYSADKSVSVDQVIDKLKKNRILQEYNTSTKTFDSNKSANKSNLASEFLNQTKKEPMPSTS